MPPNDPRILAMTKEQIELEFQHIAIDKRLKDGGETYEDDEYDNYEKETDELDSKLSDAPELPNSESYKEDEWEDVDEIDDE